MLTTLVHMNKEKLEIINVEIKARVKDIEETEQLLLKLSPQFQGLDVQEDIYFNVGEGRLKLRRGNIENALIHYVRPNTSSAKRSDILLYKHSPDENLLAILSEVLGVKVVVEKTRKIYFLDNVKFHFDQVDGLGSYVEIEAIDTDRKRTEKELREQCDFYTKYLGIQETDLISESYSDMLIKSV